jgi:hypothetical protein
LSLGKETITVTITMWYRDGKPVLATLCTGARVNGEIVGGTYTEYEQPSAIALAAALVEGRVATLSSTEDVKFFDL